MSRPHLTPGTQTTPSSREDLELVGRVLRGDDRARVAFVERMRCVSRILAAQNARLGRALGHDELADLSQVTLLVVWKKLGDYAGNASLETWVYRFCYLELMNWMRKRSRQPGSLSDIPDGLEPQAGNQLGCEVEGGESFRSLLKHLAPREAEIVHLRHAEDLDTKEISARLGVSVSSVKTQYYRGLEKLREVLRAARKAEGE